MRREERKRDSSFLIKSFFFGELVCYYDCRCVTEKEERERRERERQTDRESGWICESPRFLVFICWLTYATVRSLVKKLTKRERKDEYFALWLLVVAIIVTNDPADLTWCLGEFVFSLTTFSLFLFHTQSYMAGEGKKAEKIPTRQLRC